MNYTPTRRAVCENHKSLYRIYPGRVSVNFYCWAVLSECVVVFILSSAARCSLDCEVTYSVSEHRGRERDEEEDNKPSNRSCVQGIDVPACVHRRRGTYLNCKFQYQIEDEIGKCRNAHSEASNNNTCVAQKSSTRARVLALVCCSCSSDILITSATSCDLHSFCPRLLKSTGNIRNMQNWENFPTGFLALIKTSSSIRQSVNIEWLRPLRRLWSAKC